jgi:hypothetical protein
MLKRRPSSSLPMIHPEIPQFEFFSIAMAGEQTRDFLEFCLFSYKFFYVVGFISTNLKKYTKYFCEYLTNMCKIGTLVFW